MHLAILSVLRNEAHRWLPSVLNAWSQFADVIVALDDGSEDSTPAILQGNPKVEYHRRNGAPMWGAEAGVRQELWRLGVASGATWLLVLDADMLPAKDPRPLLAEPADAVAFKLYDLWSLEPPLYRWDGYWQAHQHHRIWAVRNPGPAFADEWPERGIHCGHFPMNLAGDRLIYAPQEHSLLHLAYSDKTERSRKAEQYAAKAFQLSRQEQLHAASITDPLVHLAPVPFDIAYDIRKTS